MRVDGPCGPCRRLRNSSSRPAASSPDHARACPVVRQARRGSRGDDRQETPGLERAEHDPAASEVVARVEPHVHLDERAEAVQRGGGGNRVSARTNGMSPTHVAPSITSGRVPSGR